MDLKWPFPVTILTLYLAGSNAAYNGRIGVSGFEDMKVFSFEQCYRVCGYTHECSSVLWNKLSKICRLNKGGNSPGLSSPLVLNAPFNSLEALRGPCMERPCRSDQVCVPVTRSNSFVCLLAQTTSTPTTSAQPSSSTESTTNASPTTSSSSSSSTTTTGAPSSTSVSTTTVAPNSSSTTAATAASILSSSVTTTASTSTVSTTTTTTASTPTASSTTTTTTALISTESTTTTASTSTSSESTTTTTTASTSTSSESTTANDACSVCSAENVDAECVDGACQCSIGYGWDKEIRLCRKMGDCAILGTSFDIYPGYFISGYNMVDYASGCVAQCLIQDCYTIDAGTRCYLQKVFWFDVGTSSWGYPPSQYVHYQRKCETWS